MLGWSTALPLVVELKNYIMYYYLNTLKRDPKLIKLIINKLRILLLSSLTLQYGKVFHFFFKSNEIISQFFSIFVKLTYC